MRNFAYGFSDSLVQLALQHRPTSSDLNFHQILELCGLSDYSVIKVTDKKFTVPYGDGIHGIDDGLHLIWQVRIDGWNLIYYPTLHHHYYHGDNYGKITEMLFKLTQLLPKIGIHKTYIPLEEEAITLPIELQKDDDDNVIFIMFKSEFQEKYQSLYSFLKEKMTPDR